MLATHSCTTCFAISAMRFVERHHFFITFISSGILHCLQHTTLSRASSGVGRLCSQRQRLFTRSAISGVLHCSLHTTLPTGFPYLRCVLPHGHNFFITLTISGVFHCLEHTAVSPASPKVGWLLPQRRRLSLGARAAMCSYFMRSPADEPGPMRDVSSDLGRVRRRTTTLLCLILYCTFEPLCLPMCVYCCACRVSANTR